jgi:low affinity Fe/Cu permease
MAKKAKPDVFSRFTSKASIVLGHAWVFTAALVLLLLWGVGGPLFGFSDTWQLVVNTTTTIVTFLMVFVIQNTQNRDNLVMNIKLDAVMRNLGITQEDLLEAEEQSDKYLEKKKRHVQRIAKKK